MAKSLTQSDSEAVLLSFYDVSAQEMFSLSKKS